MFGLIIVDIWINKNSGKVGTSLNSASLCEMGKGTFTLEGYKFMLENDLTGNWQHCHVKKGFKKWDLTFSKRSIAYYLLHNGTA